MGRPGTLLYRCRLCGGVGRNPHVPDALVGLIAAAAGERFPTEWGGLSAGPTAVHACSPGRYGVADLFGAEEDGEPGVPE